MNKNEIVARFVGVETKMFNNEMLWALETSPHTTVCQWIEVQYLDFDSNYNSFMSAWVKFRDLNLPFTDTNNYRAWDWYRTVIANTITHGTIAESFDELCKGIEWYNSLNTKHEKL